MRVENRAHGAQGVLLAVLAVLAGCYQSSDEVGGESHFLRPCQQQAQCDDLGPQFSCVAGFCRGESGGAADGTNAVGDGPLDPATPLVLLLVDTSGSLERLASCTCTTPGCEECLPDCTRGDRNRFTNVLEALTGTFDDFSCDVLSRQDGDEDPGNDTYDTGYYLPYHRPIGQQRSDGLLDQYRDRLRFGLATFDGMDSWVGAPPLVAADEYDFALSSQEQGLWSYNPDRDIPGFVPEAPQPSGTIRYPNTATFYFMDTGIRGPNAREGALQIADAAHAGRVNHAIQSSLLAVRPYGGTPIASSLDDLYYLFSQDPSTAIERDRGTEVHAVLITDGYPDDDYRTFGCNCNVDGDPSDPQRCGPMPLNDPATMNCPYPTAEEAARALRCGRGARCDGPITALHVVAFAVDDAVAQGRLDAIAIEGGDQGAHLAPDALSLRTELEGLLAAIAR